MSRNTNRALAKICGIAAILVAVSAVGQSYHNYSYLTEINWLEPDVESSDEESHLSFTAFGQEFSLNLKNNDRLLRNLTTEQARRFRQIDVFRGTVEGRRDSWVRLTRNGNTVSGAIWDGLDLYSLQQQLPNANAQFHRNTNLGTVVYRIEDGAALSHSLRPLSDLIIRSTEPDTVDVVSSESSGSEPEILQAVISPAKQISIGVLADHFYVNSESAAAEQRLLNTMNIVDGIFFWQVGVQVVIGALETFDEVSDPFTADEPVALLNQVEDYRENSPDQNALGLTHLFTGRELIEPANSDFEIVGIANLGSVCSDRFGVALTQANSGTMQNALIATHEIAHNFGAPHDGEAGSPCVDAPEQLMAPRLNGSDEFSQCSLDQMVPEIDAASCLANIPDNDLTLSLREAPTLVDVGQRFQVAVNIDTSGPSDALGVDAIFELGSLSLNHISTGEGGSAWNCEDIGAVHRCRRYTIPGDSTRRLTLSLIQNERAPVILPIRLESVTDSNLTNNSLTLNIPIIPDVELETQMSTELISIRNREESSVTATITNSGTEIANAVEVEVHQSSFLEMIAVTPSSGMCGPPNQQQLRLCEIGDVEAGGSRTIEFRFRGPEARPRSPGSQVWDRESVAIIAKAMLNGVEIRRDNAVTDIFVSERLVDLSVSISGPTQSGIGERVDYVIELANLGPDESTHINLAFNYVSSRIELNSFMDDAAACVHEAPSRRVFCQYEQLLPGESQTITVSGTPIEARNFALSVDTWRIEWDLDPANSRTSLELAVSEAEPPDPGPIDPPPPPDPSPPPPSGEGEDPPPTSPPAANSGGGGGGSSGLIWLAFLVVLLGTRGNRAALHNP